MYIHTIISTRNHLLLAWSFSRIKWETFFCKKPVHNKSSARTSENEESFGETKNLLPLFGIFGILFAVFKISWSVV